MSEPVVKRRPGRPPKSANSTPKAKPTSATPASDKSSAKKATKRNVLDDSVILSGGRSKRTPKPNPKYMDETVFSSTKSHKEDSAESETADEDIEDVLSDEYRAPSIMPLKKRNLNQKSFGIKKSPTSGGPGRRPGTTIKRKLGDMDIDIDDDRGKQLFLDAKRRLTHSPLNSDDEKSPKGDSSVLAAKLRAKYGDNLPRGRGTSIGKLSNRNSLRITEKKITRSNKNDGDSEDSEQTPTFTIVNIDDIISDKEGDIVIKKQKRGTETETSDDDVNNRNASDHESPKNANNRRKTQHTKILSEERIIRTTRRTATPPAKSQSPLTQNRLAQDKLQSPPKTFQARNNNRSRDGSSKPTILRPPPPRILNSTLCKPANKTVPSLVTKLVSKTDLGEVNNKNNNTISSRSKENVTSYTYTEKDGKLIPKKSQVTIQRKTVLPVNRNQQQQRIITSPQTNFQQRSIKKITCYENWYVIKMPEVKPKIEKSNVSLSLIKIGNEIATIELPSNEWNYKINLVPIKKNEQTKIENKKSETDKSKELNKSKDGENRNEKDEKLEIKDKKDDDKKNKKDSTNESTDEKKSSETIENDQNESSDKDSDENNTKTDSDNEVYNGEVQDSNIDPNEKHNYQPTTILFRRKCQNPNARLQFDRIVVFKNNTFLLNVDGKNIKLIGSPPNVDSLNDIQVLLDIINDIKLTSKCVELISQSS